VLPAQYLGFRAPHALLALSPGVGAYVNVWLLHRGLVRSGVLKPTHHWRALLARQLPVATLALAGFLWWASGEWEAWIGAASWVQVTWLALCVVGGVAVYGAAMWLLGLRPRDLRAV
jgi:putative peptidoglycan lipid II flippase